MKVKKGFVTTILIISALLLCGCSKSHEERKRDIEKKFLNDNGESVVEFVVDNYSFDEVYDYDVIRDDIKEYFEVYLDELYEDRLELIDYYFDDNEVIQYLIDRYGKDDLMDKIKNH